MIGNGPYYVNAFLKKVMEQRELEQEQRILEMKKKEIFDKGAAIQFRSQDHIARAKHFRMQMMTFQDIAKKLGLASNTVRNLIHKAVKFDPELEKFELDNRAEFERIALERKRDGHNKRTPGYDKREKVRAAILKKEGMTVTELCERFNCSRTTVINVWKKVLRDETQYRADVASKSGNTGGTRLTIRDVYRANGQNAFGNFESKAKNGARKARSDARKSAASSDLGVSL